MESDGGLVVTLAFFWGGGEVDMLMIYLRREISVVIASVEKDFNHRSCV